MKLQSLDSKELLRREIVAGDQTFHIVTILLLSLSGFLSAHFTRIPSILYLLLLGLIAGPVTHVIDPNALMGPFLIPFVTLSVGLILFEGGLTLHASDIFRVGRTVLLLITVGALVSFGLTSVAAYHIAGTSLQVSLILGAITVVSGPTVVQPLLRHIRPKTPLGTILRWEGILIDPVGVLLAVIVVNAISHTSETGFLSIAAQIAANITTGTLCGLISGALMTFLLKRHLIPDHLHIPTCLTVLITFQTISNAIHHESGLLAATVMGFYIANASRVHVHPIIEFNEILRDILIGLLFILLSARLSTDSIYHINSYAFLLLLTVIFVVRPAAVFVSTFFEPLSIKQKIFLSFVAPRGIVAASVASLVSLQLASTSINDIDALDPLTFFLIIGTVTFYSLFSSPIAKALGLQEDIPQGILIVGAHRFARIIGKALADREFKIIMVDTNSLNVARAQSQGLQAYHGNILSEELRDGLDIDGIGRLCALTTNDEANSLAAVHFSPFFGGREVYQLPPEDSSDLLSDGTLSVQPAGRILFDSTTTFSSLTLQFEDNNILESQHATEDFDTIDSWAPHFPSSIPLFLIQDNGKLQIVTAENTDLSSSFKEIIFITPGALKTEPAG